MCRVSKIILVLCQIAITVVIIISLRCEHKKFTNPYDLENVPPAPHLLSPVDDTTSSQNPPYFEWNVEEDSLNPLCGEELIYEIQIDDNQNFSSIDFANSTLYDNHTIPYYFHASEGNYYWRVRAKYTNGCWGEWSEIRKFKVKFPVIGSCNIAYQKDIAVSDNFAFLTYYHDLNIIDILNPYNPNLISTFSDTIICFDYIFISGNCLYTTYAGGKFSIYDIINPANPVLLDQLELPLYYVPTDLWVENDYAYICRNDYNILIFDVSNPESTFVVDSLPASGEKIIVEDNYAYILIENGMRILDLSTNTIISSIYPSGGFMQSFWISDNYAYIAGQNTWIYDISNPYNPSLVSTIDKSSYSITVAKNYLFFTFYDNIGEYPFYSLDIYDITNPLILAQIGTVYHAYGEIFSDNNFVYVIKPKFSIIKYE